MSPTDRPGFARTLAKVQEGQQLPDRRAIEVLLNEFFFAPITPACVDRLDAAVRALVADPNAKSVQERALQANKNNYLGQAWREVLSNHAVAPSLLEVVAWLAVTTPGYPAPRPYCPPRLVGTWTQLEPHRATWHLDADGNVKGDEPRLASYKHWSIHKIESRDDLVGDKLMFLSDDSVHPLRFSIDAIGPRSATLRDSGRDVEVTYELDRPMSVLARSSIEMTFAASLEPCPRCGTRELGTLEIHGDTDAWAYTTVCPSCEMKRAFKFATQGAPYDAKTKPYELGDGPSTLISAQQFRNELARVLPMVDEAPTKLSPKAWYVSRDALWRAMTCVSELAKLEPTATLAAQRARLLSILKTYTADGDRIYDLEHA